MKTAVSIPDSLFKQADKLAKRLRVSRSELYARALSALVQRMSDEEITRRLNEAYPEDDPDAGLDPFVREASRRVFRRMKW